MLIEVDFRALGLLISKYRHLSNLSQERLAERIGVSTNFLGNIERGEKHPSVETLFKICVALDLPLNELLNSSVSQPVRIDDRHTLRDSSPGYSDAFTAALLREMAELGRVPEVSQFGYLDIGDEYGFIWKE